MSIQTSDPALKALQAQCTMLMRQHNMQLAELEKLKRHVRRLEAQCDRLSHQVATSSRS